MSSGLLLRDYRCLGFTCSAYKTEACYSHDDRHVMTGSEDGGVYTLGIVSGERIGLARRPSSATSSGVTGVAGVASLAHHPSKPFFLASYYGCATAFAFKHD